MIQTPGEVQAVSDHPDHQPAVRLPAGTPTDVRVTFERARSGLGLSPERRRDPGATADRPVGDLVAAAARPAN